MLSKARENQHTSKTRNHDLLQQEIQILALMMFGLVHMQLLDMWTLPAQDVIHSSPASWVCERRSCLPSATKKKCCSTAKKKVVPAAKSPANLPECNMIPLCFVSPPHPQTGRTKYCKHLFLARKIALSWISAVSRASSALGPSKKEELREKKRAGIKQHNWFIEIWPIFPKNQCWESFSNRINDQQLHAKAQQISTATIWFFAPTCSSETGKREVLNFSEICNLDTSWVVKGTILLVNPENNWKYLLLLSSPSQGACACLASRWQQQVHFIGTSSRIKITEPTAFSPQAFSMSL